MEVPIKGKIRAKHHPKVANKLQVQLCTYALSFSPNVFRKGATATKTSSMAQPGESALFITRLITAADEDEDEDEATATLLTTSTSIKHRSHFQRHRIAVLFSPLNAPAGDRAPQESVPCMYAAPV